MTTLLWVAAALAGLVVLLSWLGAMVAMRGGMHVPMRHKPEDYGLPYELVEFKAADGVTLRGWWLEAARPSNRTVIGCHGWGSNKGEVLESIWRLREAGFNLLVFDFRCCGLSEGKLMSIGALEARDFDGALAWLKKRRPSDRVGVYGISMGSMVCFAALTRHPELEAAALECLYPSHDESLIRYARVKFGLTRYPFMPLVLFFQRRGLGFDPRPVTCPAVLAPRVDGVPILAICGADDPIATPDGVERLLSVLKTPAELWVVPGAGHAKCGEAGGDEYRRRLERFFSVKMPA